MTGKGSEYQIKCNNYFRNVFTAERVHYRRAQGIAIFRTAGGWIEGRDQGLTSFRVHP